MNRAAKSSIRKPSAIGTLGWCFRDVKLGRRRASETEGIEGSCGRGGGRKESESRVLTASLRSVRSVPWVHRSLRDHTWGYVVSGVINWQRLTIG